MHRALLFLVSLPILIIPSNGAASESLGPLTGRNQAPLLNLFYVMPVTSTETLGAGRSEFRFDLDISNIFERHINGTSTLIYAMEIYRPSFHFTRGLSDSLDIHFEIPFLSFGDGRIDGLIRDYHDLFGMPDGGRNAGSDYEYGYLLTQNGRTVFDFQAQGLNLSDINLDLKWKVLSDRPGRPALSLRAGVKLPTGELKDGTGSGRPDFSAGVVLAKVLGRFTFFAGGDYTLLNEPSELESIVEDDIIHYFIGTEFRAIEGKLSLVIQFDGQNTPYAATGHKQLDKEVLELVTGVKGLHLDKKLLWQLSIREDMIKKSTVDFTLSFSVGARF